MTAMQLCLIHFVVVRIHTTNRPPPKNLASPSMFESECRKPEEKTARPSTLTSACNFHTPHLCAVYLPCPFRRLPRRLRVRRYRKEVGLGL